MNSTREILPTIDRDVIKVENRKRRATTRASEENREQDRRDIEAILRSARVSLSSEKVVEPTER